MTIKQILANLKTIIQHKFWVCVYGRQCGLGVWQALVHDLSKLGKAEFGPYARNFFNPDGSKKERSKEPAQEWTEALNHHYKSNPHHWNHWVHQKGEKTYMAHFPVRYVREMVADWMAAGKVYSGSMNVAKWYSENKGKMKIASAIMEKIEDLIAEVDPKGYMEYVYKDPYPTLDEINRRNLSL